LEHASLLVTFGDIWCLFVSFGPAPHIYQRGERVGEPGFSYPGGLHIIVLLKFDLKLASVCVSSRTGESLIINQLQDLTLVVVVVVTNADGRDASEGVLEAKPA